MVRIVTWGCDRRPADATPPLRPGEIAHARTFVRLIPAIVTNARSSVKVEQVFASGGDPCYRAGGAWTGRAPPQRGAAMGTALTERQLRILQVIREAVEARGYPPSVREIGEAVGLRSPSSVHSQLATLADRGYLRRDPSRPRAIELRFDLDTELSLHPAPTRTVPLVGEIAAGAPILAEERIEQAYALPKDLGGEGTLFMLRVRGESMVEAGVMPGDLVVVRKQEAVEQGEMCAALVDGEATVKFFRRTPVGEVFLDPANPAFEPIPVAPDADAAILGKVVAVLRSL
jgi:repressor LexA